MQDLDHARNLMAMAQKDFDALRAMADNPLFADEIFGFHAQQAIEKALKAWLCARSVSPPFTHDLSRLLDLLEENEDEVSAFWPLVQYTVFAVQARYDLRFMDDEEPLDRRHTLEEVSALFAAIPLDQD